MKDEDREERIGVAAHETYPGCFTVEDHEDCEIAGKCSC